MSNVWLHSELETGPLAAHPWLPPVKLLATPLSAHAGHAPRHSHTRAHNYSNVCIQRIAERSTLHLAVLLDESLQVSCAVLTIALWPALMQG